MDETKAQKSDTTSPPDETSASASIEKPEVGETNTPDQATVDLGDIERRRHSRSLERPLTDEEKLKIGDEMARAMQEAGRLEAKKKALDDELKGEISSLWERASTLAASLQKGHREALIECETIRDFKAGTVEILRLDTGEVVEPLRAMTAAERQVGLYGDAGGRASTPEVLDGVVNPGSWAEEADLEAQASATQTEMPGVEPAPTPAEAIAQTAREATDGEL
jgi:hypothetical protein